MRPHQLSDLNIFDMLSKSITLRSCVSSNAPPYVSLQAQFFIASPNSGQRVAAGQFLCHIRSEMHFGEYQTAEKIHSPRAETVVVKDSHEP